MYFQLEVDETLANAMRAAAELRAEIDKVIKEEESRVENILIITDLWAVKDDIGSIISQIGEFAGMLLANKAIDEADKATTIKND